MAVLDSLKKRLKKRLHSAAPVSAVQEAAIRPKSRAEDHGHDHDDEKGQVSAPVDPGVQTIEAAKALWGRHGRWLIIAGLGLVMTIYEIDNSTVYIYNNYSTSSFGALSKLASLSAAGSIIFAIVKPPIAKVSNVIGRGQTYLLTISFYILAYILMASATTFNTYAAGTIFYSVGQSGTNIMNDIVISDITTARWRPFAIGLTFTPFLVTPWIAGFIVASVVSPTGIGWRWGIGMFAILMPFCASFIITTLLYYQAKAKKEDLAPRVKIGIVEFCSQIDLGGIILFSGGLAMILVPLTLAATTSARWKTPYLDALIGIGCVLLIALPFYEKFMAKHPIVPVRYFLNRTIVCCLILIAVDSLGFACTHTYLYVWVTVAKGFAARDATFFTYTNGVMQCLTGILAGLLMGQLRRYKWIAVVGSVVRLVGYGVMLRLRGAENSTGEIYVVQLIQGLGSGMIQTCLLVPAQIVVIHAEMPQVTALVICFSFVGGSIGACIAGGIYTNTLVPALWRYMPDGTQAAAINALANSITGVVPDWGTFERTAIALAFSDVMRYTTYAALGASVIGLGFALLLPNFVLPEKNNLVEE
ncbi:major facilitator superfamily domain-containing protein [Pseudomassariella vexata]|uniref:Major facilitator superfamily domain-containing protein n=1 Tax=Pseudomassariella vexata TaxID=1141098 RepID=A0A1Y2DNB7_9PEZI|nr:major facilitator superfamily domain-containing protein [Pseudomassariella vexata]ORY60669.1 major facilitator superfamily domain-containing protein [Pseudomassariella vexata]